MTTTMTMKCHNGHDYHSIELLKQRNLHRLLFCRSGSMYLELLHNWDIDDTDNVLDQWDLSLQQSVKDFLCRPHDTWKAMGLYLL